MPSSSLQKPVAESGCVEGILIELSQEEVVPQVTSEVCLVAEGGEDLDLILWEDIKEGEIVRFFSLATDGELSGRRSRGVQTEPMSERRPVC